MSYQVEDFEAIRRRQEEIRAELDLLLKGTSAPAEAEKKVGEAATEWPYAPDYCY